MSLLRNVFVLCEVKSLESVQVKLSAIEIKVQFTLLLGNFEQDFRLLMNDLSNLFRAKESMAQIESISSRNLRHAGINLFRF